MAGRARSPGPGLPPRGLARGLLLPGHLLLGRDRAEFPALPGNHWLTCLPRDHCGTSERTAQGTAGDVRDQSQARRLVQTAGSPPAARGRAGPHPRASAQGAGLKGARAGRGGPVLTTTRVLLRDRRAEDVPCRARVQTDGKRSLQPPSRGPDAATFPDPALPASRTSPAASESPQRCRLHGSDGRERRVAGPSRPLSVVPAPLKEAQDARQKSEGGRGSRRPAPTRPRGSAPPTQCSLTDAVTAVSRDTRVARVFHRRSQVARKRRNTELSIYIHL